MLRSATVLLALTAAAAVQTPWMLGNCAECVLGGDSVVKVNHVGAGGIHDKHKCWMDDPDVDGHVIQFGASNRGTLRQDAADTEKHEVRCCADVEIDEFVKKSHCSVWGESPKNPTCIHDATFDEAIQHCADIGARLCTVKEVEDDCTKGSGCGHDHDRVWTSTEAENTITCKCFCAHSETADAYMIQRGKSNGNGPQSANADATHKVRCCSDEPLEGFVRRDIVDQPMCAAVWAFKNENHHRPECDEALTWAEAVTKCHDIGARLCTAQELSDDCTRGSGCNLDDDELWSSTPSI